MFEGKEEPKVEPAAGYQQTKWLNNIDPSYAENAHHPWLTGLGISAVVLARPPRQPLSEAVYAGGKDVKGLGQTRISVDPKRATTFSATSRPSTSTSRATSAAPTSRCSN